MSDLTAKQLENLRKLAAAESEHAAECWWLGFTGREVAKILWPDSPAWGRRTRFHAASNNSQGSIGGTMPMLGARRARELADLGMLSIHTNEHYQPKFRLTSAGRRYLEEHPE